MEIKFVDLFSGMGGIRQGFEQACSKQGFTTKCILTSEIKPHAIKVLQQNYKNEIIKGDIREIQTKDIEDFDFLLAGFPCQAFSSAGKRMGFLDTRGTLFFEVERILKDKKPFAFILENVEGLVTHDKEKKEDKIGRTLNIILKSLKNLGYKVTWQVLNAKDFGIPQNRKRIYIVGTKKAYVSLADFPIRKSILNDILETNLKSEHNYFIDNLLKHYSLEELEGKAIQDKRGGANNIHSWDLEIRGSISKKQKLLLNTLLTQRRKAKWAREIGIDFMDGIPLSLKQISTFFEDKDLDTMLNDLVLKKYLRYEHPKKKVLNKREIAYELEKGYNIVTGKMTFPISKILDRYDITPTLVAMDMQKLYITNKDGLRRLSLREGLRLFGYSDKYIMDIDDTLGYDLLGNTVIVPIIEEIATRSLQFFTKD